MIFEPGTRNLPFVEEILRPNEANYAVHEKRLERASDAIGAGFQGKLIDAMMSLGRQRAALAGFEVHHVIAFPGHVATAVMIENLLASLGKHCECDSKASVGGLRSRYGLEQ